MNSLVDASGRLVGMASGFFFKVPLDFNCAKKLEDLGFTLLCGLNRFGIIKLRKTELVIVNSEIFARTYLQHLKIATLA